jgi:hypothetical protein
MKITTYATQDATRVLQDIPSEPTREDVSRAVHDAVAQDDPSLVPMKVNLNGEAYSALQEIADAHNTTLTEALHRAISTELAAVRSKRRFGRGS